MNKKIVFSLLTIGIFACVASAGTWAYFQDTITSTGNGIQTAKLVTEYSTDLGATWKTVPASGTITISNVELKNIVPASESTFLPAQNLWIRGQNKNVKAKVHVTIRPDPTKGTAVIPGLIMNVANYKVYDGTEWKGFLEEYTTEGLDAGSPIPAGDYNARYYDVTYNFKDLETNQNEYQGKKVVFDIIVTVTASR